MKNNFKKEFFVFVKFFGLMFFIITEVVSFQGNIKEASLYFVISSVFLIFAISAEYIDESNKKRKIETTIGEGILSAMIIFLFPVEGLIYVAITLSDFYSMHKLNEVYYFYEFSLLALCAFFDFDMIFNVMAITFIVCMYYQEKNIVNGLKNVIEENEENETRLKTDIRQSDKKHESEMNKSRLKYENMMLEEKGQISQALHDKLGHSINGSLYKLEAAKLLVDKKPEESKNILQEVIDNLRGSMDEIRAILRREKPDKKKTSLLALHKLCDECETEYGIKAILEINEFDKKIPENIWEIILDNTFEAVTNALKYSKCKTIYISINVMNQIVRCTIQDDGVGADSFTAGMGIEGMKKRVRNVKGYLDIETEAGFAINMLLPLQ